MIVTQFNLILNQLFSTAIGTLKFTPEQSFAYTKLTLEGNRVQERTGTVDHEALELFFDPV